MARFLENQEAPFSYLENQGDIELSGESGGAIELSAIEYRRNYQVRATEDQSYRRYVVELLLGLNIRDDFADLVSGELVDKGGHHVPAELGFDADVLDARFAAGKGKLLVLKEAE